MTVFMQFLLGVVVVFSPNIITYVVFRTLQGVVNDTVLSLVFVIGKTFNHIISCSVICIVHESTLGHCLSLSLCMSLVA